MNATSKRLLFRIAPPLLAAVAIASLSAGCAGRKPSPARPAKPAPSPAGMAVEAPPPPPVLCPVAPGSRQLPPLPPPQAEAAPPPARVERRAPPDRIVRVLAAGPVKTVRIEGCPIRAWKADGTLLAEWSGNVALTADGERIRAGASQATGSIDVGSDAPFVVGGKKLPPGRVRVLARQGNLFAVAALPLEEYVAAVVSREGAPSFHPSALAALAVAIRTYTVNALAKPRDPAYDLLSGVGDQVFEGFDRVHPQFRKAAEDTRGELLWFGDAPARANYHSTCGGSTESAGAAWGKEFPYLVPVGCEDCRESPAFRWEYRLTQEEGKRIAQALGVRARDDLGIEVASLSPTGRAARIRLSSGRVSREISAAAFRQSAGTTRVKSLKMEISRSGDGWRISGDGYGHGVGMCQWGSDGMARRGLDYREILSRYYPGTRLSGGAS